MKKHLNKPKVTRQGTFVFHEPPWGRKYMKGRKLSYFLFQGKWWLQCSPLWGVQPHNLTRLPTQQHRKWRKGGRGQLPSISRPLQREVLSCREGEKIRINIYKLWELYATFDRNKTKNLSHTVMNHLVFVFPFSFFPFLLDCCYLYSQPISVLLKLLLFILFSWWDFSLHTT